MIGCRDAVDRCKALAEKKLEGKKWEGDDGVRQFLDTEVFALSGQKGPANNKVL